jgi:hypothetical protein
MLSAIARQPIRKSGIDMLPLVPPALGHAKLSRKSDARNCNTEFGLGGDLRWCNLRSIDKHAV